MQKIVAIGEFMEKSNSDKIKHDILQSIFENYGNLETKAIAYNYGVSVLAVSGSKECLCYFLRDFR